MILKEFYIFKQASKFKDFQNLKINRDLIKFFTRSEAILKFFEELRHERVEFRDLIVGDTICQRFRLNTLNILPKN